MAIIFSIGVLITSASIPFFNHQIDVKTTFLNRNLEEEIYIVQLKDCVIFYQENKVYKLLKSLYALK